MATKEQPQVTVRGIPQNQYNDNVAATTQQTGDDPNQGGGIEGHFKKHWVLYTLGIGVVGILVVIWLNNNNSNNAGSTGIYGGYGTGNTGANGAPSDSYGSQLDADYQQMINENNITNSLLQQLLNGTGTGSTTGGTSGSGSSSGSSGSHHHGSGGGKSKGGSKSSGGSSSHKSSGGGSTKKTTTHGSSSSVSGHATGTSHSNGKTTITHNKSGYGKQKNYTTSSGGWYITGPGAKPKNARYVTVPKGSSLSSLQSKYFPGSSGSPKQGNIVAYGKNYNAFKGNVSNKGVTTKNLRIQV